MCIVFPSRCLFYSPLTDGGSRSIPTDEQLTAIFHKDLVMNVFRNGVFGSFRHISLLSGSCLCLLTSSLLHCQERCKVLPSICLFVRLHISETTWPNFTKFLSVQNVTMAQSSSGSNAINYLLLVFLVTLCIRIMDHRQVIDIFKW